MGLLNNDDKSWASVVEEWRVQCCEEDFEIFCDGLFVVLENLVTSPEDGAGVLGAVVDGKTVAICQVNCKEIKGYDGPVLRVRHIVVSPHYDLTDVSHKEYAQVIVGLFQNIMELSADGGKMAAKHIKLHLRSVGDQQFFAALGYGLRRSDYFEAVQTKGAWLYITKA